MKIPFTKAHGAKNDFLLTWSNEAPTQNLPEAAIAICDRHTGVGADGWILISPPVTKASEYDFAIQLFNSDGSFAEISGNGTRCAAAFVLDTGFEKADVRLLTGAGVKRLRMLGRQDLTYTFEMEMGSPELTPAGPAFQLPLSSGPRDVTILDVGNPQCAIPVGDFEFDWLGVAREVEAHAHFPNRTNVSFFRRIDDHTLEARFYERGAGETMSSGTGSTGAAAAAVARGMVSSPILVLTPAGPLNLRVESGVYCMVGPAEIVAGGEFYL